MLPAIKSANIFYKLSRRDFMDGCGLVPMDTSASSDIACLKDTCLSRSSKRLKRWPMTRSLSWWRRLILREINWVISWHQLLKRVSRDGWSRERRNWTNRERKELRLRIGCLVWAIIRGWLEENSSLNSLIYSLMPRMQSKFMKRRKI